MSNFPHVRIFEKRREKPTEKNLSSKRKNASSNNYRYSIFLQLIEMRCIFNYFNFHNYLNAFSKAYTPFGNPGTS